MSNQKQAFSYGVIGIGALAIVMVLFYYFADRFRAAKQGGDWESAPVTEYEAEDRAEFVGIYSPSDGAMESREGRISYFVVNRRTEGGYLGSAKVDEIGGDQTSFFNCHDVRISSNEFFLNCSHQSKGSISFNGNWQGDQQVTGRVLWVLNGEPILESGRSLQFRPAD